MTLDALTPASVHSSWSSPKCLNLWVFAWQYSQACGNPCCLCTFSFPISSLQSTLHLICFDTALLEQPPLSVMTLCDLLSLWRVSMFVFWTIAKSAVFPIIVVSKNKRYPEFIQYGLPVNKTLLQIAALLYYCTSIFSTLLFKMKEPHILENQ